AGARGRRAGRAGGRQTRSTRRFSSARRTGARILRWPDRPRSENVVPTSRVRAMSILGNRVTRSEDPRFITGTATFGDDVDPTGVMHATFVRSVLPHARITNIDTSAVSEIPGARAFTAADMGLTPLPQAMPGLNEGMVREVVPSDVTRFAGEIVAVVVTEERMQGPDAAELVIVDVEALPPVPDAQAAVDGDAYLF